MQPLRIADAFEPNRIDPARLEEIVECLKSYEASTIKAGPAYNQDTGIYSVRFYDQGHVFNPKLPQYRIPIEITETELYAVQEAFRTALSLEFPQLIAKLEEAERRIIDAKDYVAEDRAERERIKQEAAKPYHWPGLQKS